MKVDILVQFLALLEELRSPRDAIHEFERLLDRCGFDYYGLIRRPHANAGPLSRVLAGRWPDRWPEIYLEKRYVGIDPTVRYLGHARAGFRWRESLSAFRSDPNRKRMERMMVDARNNGLEDGYIFPVHGRRGLLGNLTVGGRTVDLHAVEIALFDSIARVLFWKLIDLTDPEKSAVLSADAGVQLTRREMETLGYLAEGMTSNEIARVLQISNHTVDWYMNGLQDKLKAKNRHHAVALSFRLGLVS
ncbi:LuxR family transcriptional regulator [Rhizobium sp. TRM95111]|uniref:helix-turn-helix transcriptional regulator n=1 Tax=Rhizobium alarense TaxID=2846851 RepID=UPI001F3538A1|nr:LuxR family transcriptional regulator [Rhizobium alarense]MCF3641333.1 LuxR family transcriptional regulator [Rhizobium alarense]